MEFGNILCSKYSLKTTTNVTYRPCKPQHREAYSFPLGYLGKLEIAVNNNGVLETHIYC
jgi:hypothetical protein